MSRDSPRSGLNRLAASKSPYLRLHADDPVDWYPWGEEAFRKAREEDKPIMLSIGYLSCHWCHVMQRETFKSRVISDILNRHFVSVKVDREERPDIDSIYMRAVILMTGQGGWPLTVFLTPDLKPFFGGTYFPPEPRQNLPSFKDVLLAVKDAWEKRREEVLNSGSSLFEAIIKSLAIKSEGEVDFSYDVMSDAYEQLVLAFDEEFGGVKGAPKFPMPSLYLFLLRYWKLQGPSLALRMVEKTLKSIFLGGIYDHAGGGFHRYAVDSTWSVPHFEKMLYDNAMLVRLYAEAWVVTRDPLFRLVLEDTSRWIISELKSPNGGCYSSLSAESGGVEGGFYLYGWNEIVSELGEDVARLLGCSPIGNFEGGLNIVRLPAQPERLADTLGMSLIEALNHVSLKLKEIRAGKQKPEADDKVIVSWNGLLISGLSYAATILHDRALMSEAKGVADFILKKLYSPGSLRRYWRDGPSEAGGLLEDYSLLGCGLLDLYEWCGETKYFDSALSLASDILELFASKSGGFYDTPPDSDTPVRPMTIEDHSYPSGYSASVQLLSRLYLLTGEERYLQTSRDACRRAWQAIQYDPLSHISLISALPLVLGKGGQLVVAPSGEPWPELCRLASKIYEPYVVVSAGRSDSLQSLWEGKEAMRGETTYYFCREFKCLLPTTSLDELEKMMRQGL
ncbi:MAG: thioredoxin domain-containing protein [Nitrososphaerota archaeon]|nr:thioredoxin domain-containing protein [Candidatus Calditenuaceae archaeon]MDW8072911.1 thioredoxin domain-containing protein [Nitrososphaerota archaeon]